MAYLEQPWFGGHSLTAFVMHGQSARSLKRNHSLGTGNPAQTQNAAGRKRTITGAVPDKSTFFTLKVFNVVQKRR